MQSLGANVARVDTGNEKGSGMSCPKLDRHDPLVPLCLLRRGTYVPSEDQLLQLCTTSRFGRCPLYLEEVKAYLDLCRQEAERAVG